MDVLNCLGQSKCLDRLLENTFDRIGRQPWIPREILKTSCVPEVDALSYRPCRLEMEIGLLKAAPC